MVVVCSSIPDERALFTLWRNLRHIAAATPDHTGAPGVSFVGPLP